MRYVGDRCLSLILAVVLSSTVLASARECGQNPMKQVLKIAKRTGRSLDNVLTVLRGIDDEAYQILAHRFRMYAACVGLVDTGYFRKRSSHMRTDELAPEQRYSPETERIQTPEKRMTILAIPSGELWADQSLDSIYAAYEEKRSNNLPSHSQEDTSREQRTMDAADVNRTLTSIIRKAKMIMDADRMARSRVSNKGHYSARSPDDRSSLFRELFQ